MILGRMRVVRYFKNTTVGQKELKHEHIKTEQRLIHKFRHCKIQVMCEKHGKIFLYLK